MTSALILRQFVHQHLELHTAGAKLLVRIVIQWPLDRPVEGVHVARVFLDSALSDLHVDLGAKRDAIDRRDLVVALTGGSLAGLTGADRRLLGWGDADVPCVRLGIRPHHPEKVDTIEQS